jgi:hypothetical protein
VNDHDGLYVAVTPAGAISFRYNYSTNGRQETITFGRYGTGSITLSEAREQLGEAKKMIAAGKSPAREKARDKARVKDAETSGAWAEKWLRGYQMADSTRDIGCVMIDSCLIKIIAEAVVPLCLILRSQALAQRQAEVASELAQCG